MNTQEAEIQAHGELLLVLLIQQVLLRIDYVQIYTWVCWRQRRHSQTPVLRVAPTGSTEAHLVCNLGHVYLSALHSLLFKSFSGDRFPLSAVVATLCGGMLHL